MAIKTAAHLKRRFLRGMYPTETDFADLIDSFRHRQDKISLTEIGGLAEALNGKLDSSEAKLIEKRVDGHDERIRQLQATLTGQEKTITDISESCDRLNNFRALADPEVDLDLSPHSLEGFNWTSDRRLWINDAFDIAEMSYVLDSMEAENRDALSVPVFLHSGGTEIARFPAVFTRCREDEESYWDMTGHAVFEYGGSLWRFMLSSVPENSESEIELFRITAPAEGGGITVTVGDDFPEEKDLGYTCFSGTVDDTVIDTVGIAAFRHKEGHMCLTEIRIVHNGSVLAVFPATVSCPDGGNVLLQGLFEFQSGIFSFYLIKTVGKPGAIVEIGCRSSMKTVSDISGRVAALEKIYSTELRLMELGYTRTDTYRAMLSEPAMTEERIGLREGLASIGYTPKEIEDCMEDVPELTHADIAHARGIMERWDATARDVVINSTNWWAHDPKLVVFPKLDFSNVKSLYNAWAYCPNLAFMPDMDTSACESFRYLYFNGNDFAKLPQNRMKRVPNWDMTNATAVQDVYPVNLSEMILPPVIRVPKAKFLTLFRYIYNTTLPEVELDESLVISYSCMYEGSGISKPILTRFGDNVIDVQAIYKRCLNLTDMRGYSIVARNATTSQMFMSSPNVTHLPDSIVLAETNMPYGFYNMRFLEEVPDYSNLLVKNFYAGFGCGSGDINVKTNVNSSLKRIRGLNFEKVTETNFCFGCEDERENMVTRPVTYVRVLNVGKGPATTLDFRCLGNWGSDDEGYRSLVESLVTGSYDRKANGMPTAVIRLPQSVADRLGQENIALITAKGYTVSTTTV